MIEIAAPFTRIVGQGIISRPSLAEAWTPLDLPGLIVWLDGADATTLYQDSGKTTPVVVNTDPVQAWADKSGNGNDAIGAATFDNVTGLESGVRFNGSQWLELTNALANTTGTIIIIMEFDNDLSGIVDLISNDDDDTTDRYFVAGVREGAFGAAGSDVVYIFQRSANRGYQGDDDLDHAIPHVFSWATDGTSTVRILRADGVDQVNTWGGSNWTGQWFGTTTTPRSTYIGARVNAGTKSNFLSGIIYEIIVTDDDLSTENIQAAEAYASTKAGIIGNFSSNAIFLTSPAEYQVFQRSGATGNISITGTYTGVPDAIEARFNGGAWATIDATPSGNTFSGTLTNQAQGQGDLEVRFTNDTDKNATVANIGIGDIFVIAGQSNASGRGLNNQSYTHATLKAAMFKNSYSWGELTDPTDSPTAQVDAVSSDAGAAGSYWPLLATLIMADQSVPVAFVPCALTGTRISEWAKGDDNDRATLYGSMQYRAGQVGGVKAVLWHQGERDANPSIATPESTYNAALDTLANNIAADLSCGLMPCLLQDIDDSLSYAETVINAAISTAISDNANVLAGPDLYSNISLTDSGSEDGLHLKNDTDLAEAASLWWAALETEFYT